MSIFTLASTLTKEYSLFRTEKCLEVMHRDRLMVIVS